MPEGLEWMLELDAKLDGALKMVRALEQGDEALKKVDESLRKTENASARAAAGHEKHGAAAKKTEGILQRFTSATLDPFLHRVKQIAEFEFIRRGVDKLIEAPMEALHLFKELGEEMINVAAKAERTELSFKLLFGEKEGRETLEWIEKIGKYTEFSQAQLKGSAQDLAKVGFKGEDLSRAMSAATDIAAFDKSGPEGLGGAISALERIKRTGHVMDRTLGGLGIGKDDFLKELSARTGQGVEILKKNLDAGKVKAEVSIEALYAMIAKRTGKDLGGAGVAMANTLEARLTHLRELPELFFEKLRGTQGFAAISDFVGRMVELFGPESALGTTISETLNRIFDDLGTRVGGIDIEGIFRNVPPLVIAVSDAITDMVQGVNDLANAFAPVVKAIEILGRAAGIMDDTSKYGKNAAALVYDRPGQLLYQKLHDKLLISKASAAAGVPYVDPDKAFGPQQTGAERLARQYAEMGRLAGGGLRKGMENATPDAAVASAGMADKAAQSSRDALGVKSPSRVFEEIGMQTGAGFNRGVDKSMYRMDDIVGTAFSSPVPPVTTGRGTGSPTVIQVTVETNVAAGAGDHAQHTADMVSASVKEILPGALQSAIEQLANQTGAS